MSKCGQSGCLGHLGKFQDCVSEAVWQDTLDGWGRTTGNVDWDGHYSLVSYDSATDVELPEVGAVRVPRGYYIVEDTSSGAVYVVHYSTKRAAERDFGRIERAYAKWDDESELGSAAIALLAAFPILAAFAYVIGALVGMTR